MTLVFTGGGGAGVEALHRLLSDRHAVHFADADLDARPHPVPRDVFHQIPYASDPAFVDRIDRLCRRLGAGLLIPTVDEELMPIAEARATLSCAVLLPPAEFIRVHTDKLTSNTELHARGIPAPRTELLGHYERIGFPCVVKPRHGRGSRGVAIVRSEPELRAHVLLSRRQPDEFIAQELLGGQEYTVMIAADHLGRLHAIVPVKVGIKRGITLRVETDGDQQVITACESIHASNPVPGCYNIQLVKTPAGDVKPFEINPRVSTTACLGLAAGIDFVDIYLNGDKSIGRATAELLPFRTGLGLHRSWHNQFVQRA